jgi:DNA-binding response OmpR family regulator
MIPARILVIDDEARLLELMCDFLQLSGYEVEAASDGAEGLRLFTVRPHDLVLTDLRMPRLDGWAVADEVNRSSTTPVILITGAASGEDRRRAEARGLVLLQKPVDLRHLTSVVAHVLSRVGSPPDPRLGTLDGPRPSH